MSSYRFCRTDDIELLVGALNRCWAPYFPGEPPVTPAVFKRSIRDLQVWCSSCMVAMSGSAPIGVLIGAKRPSGTLIHRIAVYPDHVRQGHGRHLLASLASKLTILGPPRIVAEVPETLAPACELFSASGYVQEATLTDYVLECDASDLEPGARVQRSAARAQGASSHSGGLVIPITVDDLAANDLLESGQTQVCWERAVQTLTARKDEIAGFAIASDERIEAAVLYVKRGDSSAEILLARSFIDDNRGRLEGLLAHLGAQGLDRLTFPKVHPSEISTESLTALGFRRTGVHRLYAARAGSS